ncbi:MAG: hypothetical protein HKN67_03065 [Saprospiraceae bacterium]|nr:hypothetical protein [Saprospiraceae bacterium]
MNNSELHRIVSKWLEDPDDQELREELESALTEDPKSLASFKQLHQDFQDVKTNQISENPFFFSKLKFRMEKRQEENAHVQRVRWAIYAATMSVSIVMGVLFGNQVESNYDTSSNEEVFAAELLVEDYSIDDALLLNIEEE